jgi:hypothetical protein
VYKWYYCSFLSWISIRYGNKSWSDQQLVGSKHFQHGGIIQICLGGPQGLVGRNSSRSAITRVSCLTNGKLLHDVQMSNFVDIFIELVGHCSSFWGEKYVADKLIILVQGFQKRGHRMAIIKASKNLSILPASCTKGGYVGGSGIDQIGVNQESCQ